MFEAMMLVCMLNQPTNCMEFTDKRGPYETHPKCVVRLQEMIGDITPTIPFVPTILVKCEAKVAI